MVPQDDDRIPLTHSTLALTPTTVSLKIMTLSILFAQPTDFINGQTQNITFGGGAAETTLGPGVLGLALVLILLICTVRRKHILAPVMMGLILLPFGQTLVVGSLHLYVSRILIAVALVRIVTVSRPEGPLFAGGINTLDKLFITWALLRSVMFVLRFDGAMGAVVNQGGFLWDVLGGYLLIRFLIRNEEDVTNLLKVFAVIAIVLCVTTLYEKFSGTNLYGILAGTHLRPEVRDGHIRAQGPFHHPILCGTFAATLFPLFLLLRKTGKAPILAIAGLASSIVVPFTTSSSTPLGALMAAIVAVCLWPLRRSMRTIRWGIVLAILCLAAVMNAPVWYVLEHIHFAAGSTGLDRADLIDTFVRHFNQWWLIGTNNNASWGYDMWDVSNQYIAQGISGGLAAFLCFLGMLYLGFKWIGVSRRASAGKQKEWIFWFLGAALLSHSAAFFGISYFDQTRYGWYALLAIISVLTAPLAFNPALVTNRRRSTSHEALPALIPETSAAARRLRVGQRRSSKARSAHYFFAEKYEP